MIVVDPSFLPRSRNSVLLRLSNFISICVVQGQKDVYGDFQVIMFRLI